MWIFIRIYPANRTKSINGFKYLVVFVDTYAGAKHVDFLASTLDLMHAYKRLTSYLEKHSHILRSDQGTEIKNSSMTSLLEDNHTNHIVCSGSAPKTNPTLLV